MDNITVDILAYLAQQGIGFTAPLSTLYIDEIHDKYNLPIVKFKDHLEHLMQLKMISNFQLDLKTVDIFVETDTIKAAITKYGYDTYTNFVLRQSTLSTNKSIRKASKMQKKTFWVVLISTIATIVVSVVAVIIGWLNYKATIDYESLKQRLRELQIQITKLQSETKKPVSQKILTGKKGS